MPRPPLHTHPPIPKGFPGQCGRSKLTWGSPGSKHWGLPSPSFLRCWSTYFAWRRGRGWGEITPGPVLPGQSTEPRAPARSTRCCWSSVLGMPLMPPSAPTTTTNCSPGHLEVACDFNNPLSYPPPGIHSWFPPVRPGATPTRLKANGKCRHQGQVATCPGHSRGAQGHSGWAVTAPPPAPSPVSLSSPQDHRGFTGMGEHCCTQDSLSCWELSEWPLNMSTVGFW